MARSVLLIAIAASGALVTAVDFPQSIGFDCAVSGIFADIHDGDQKKVTVDPARHSLRITPYGNDQTWAVHAKLDPIFCNASVNFNVPGKPGPPPVALSATIWHMSKAKSPSSKKSVEFTDPSGTLGKAGSPLNIWIQVDG
eukprot:6184730-Pleurochrysis_carterae.AAC.4